ncbi:MAG TPA: MFS transporter [Candidatus Microsaccharimonas sp.]|nr:MFS transporter [Candidatus Microsaccharimonas sp.]
MKRRRLSYLLFVNLFSLTGYYAFTPLYAIYANRFVADPKTIGLVWSVYSLLLAFCVLLMGKIENRANKAHALVFGYLLCAIGAVSFLEVTNTTTLLIVLAINALGGGATLPALKTLFAKNEMKGRESEQWAWLDAGNMFAAAGGAAIGGIVVGLYGFHGLFLVMAAIQLSAAIVAYKLVFRLS